ncbi:MAG: chemotaxis protein CheW [Patescibacteria group bacterium]
MEISQYLSVFMDECAEHLQTLNQALLDLENDPENTELLNTIFRAAHTLKGASMTMGFNKMASLTSAMEDVLSRMRNREIPIAPEVVSLLFESFDLLEVLAQGIGSGREEDIEIAGVTQQLKRFASGEETGFTAGEKRREIQLRYTAEEKDILQEEMEEGTSLVHATVVMESGCLLKGARAFMILRELERHGKVIKSAPEAKDLEDENFEDTFIVGLVTRETPEEIAENVRRIIDVERVAAERINLEQVQLERRVREAIEPAQAERPGVRPAASQTVRVDIRKLDDLMGVVEELVISRSRLEQVSSALHSDELSEILEQVGHLTLELQSRVLKTRMVPVENVFRRFPRLVRDLCKEMGKEAILVVRGGETELDRTVIDEIGDPLMHILRNCLDHGIEPLEVRQAKGKPAAGTITLEAHQEGNNVVITVTDDGQGIDLAQVAARAVEMGYATREDLAEMDQADLMQLVFVPGLSTAAAITDVSGRGVGMDVVRAKIDALRGTVTVDSVPGESTVVTIRLPLTLAIIQTLMVQLGEEFYLIPTSFIDSTISVRKKDIKKVRNQEVTMLRGDVLPLVRLRTVLGLPHAYHGQTQTEYDELDVVVIRQGDRRVGCVVDGLLRQQDVVLKPLGGILGALQGIAGATILGDGRVCLILDMRSVA